jgi:uncharacterized membrane protein YhiD involved in acid resistance
MTISIDQAVIDLAVAGGLSALIGFERQWRNRLAGLRTNTLVAFALRLRQRARLSIHDRRLCQDDRTRCRRRAP